MEERKKVKVKYYTDVKHYTIIEVYEDEVEGVRRANRITWKEDHSQRQKREYLNKKGIAVCSLEEIDSDGSWIEDGRQNAEQRMVEEETRREEHEKLHKAILQLTERQQELIKLIYFQGLSQDDVAKKFGITKASVSDAMQRIYATLKKIMTKN
jgi:RNA polymerase sigma factor (sigma-70 family)